MTEHMTTESRLDTAVLVDSLTGPASDCPRLHVTAGVDDSEIALEVVIEEQCNDVERRVLRSLSFVVVDARALQDAIRLVLPADSLGPEQPQVVATTVECPGCKERQ